MDALEKQHMANTDAVSGETWGRLSSVYACSVWKLLLCTASTAMLKFWTELF